MIDLTFIAVWASMTFVILFACYILIRLTIKSELRKGLPNKIEQAKSLFKGKKVRVTLTIGKDGKTELEHWDLVKELDYVG